MKRFDERQAKKSVKELAKHEHAKPLHELERTTMKTPLQISIGGDENLCDTLPRVRSPLHENNSSQKEVMEIPLSKEYQDPRSLVDNELFPNMMRRKNKKVVATLSL